MLFANPVERPNDDRTPNTMAGVHSVYNDFTGGPWEG